MQRRHTPIGGPADVDAPPASGSKKVRRVVKKRRKVTRTSGSTTTTPFKSHFGPEWIELIQLGVMLGLVMAICIYVMSSVKTFILSNVSISLFAANRFRWYRIPGAMEKIGDKSQQYQLLRKDIDEVLPPGDEERSLQAVQSLHERTYKTIGQVEAMGYDIHNCPPEPPEGYPYAFPTLDILENWPPDDPTPRPEIFQALCVFDYRRDRSKAFVYREKEVPFVVRGDPAVAESVERWNHEDYMKRLMNTVPHRTEYSENNHFMYWIKPSKSPSVVQKLRRAANRKFKQPIIEAPSNWTEPTKNLRMPYEEWLGHANVSDDKLGPENPHWYYRLIGCGDPPHCDVGSSEYLFDELTFFQPREDQLYLKDIQQQKGIHCRFGMKGVIAENHFDGSRNFIVVLGGERRYIVSHPQQCQKLALHPKEHPSARHSAVDWSDPDLEAFPQFKEAKSSEVVLQAGDVLYLPTNWFHYIISLTLNFQCNTRSGVGTDTMMEIRKCGF